MEERRRRVRLYKQLVLQHLRRLPMNEERERPMKDLEGRRTVTEDVRLETREGGDLAIVLFRKSGTDGLFGFAMEIEEP